MKLLHIVLCLLMIAFAAVQYNDPDGLFWAAVYLIPAIWAGLAAFRLAAICTALPAGLLAACLAMSGYGVYRFWPATPEFWRVDVWWQTETAREGIGMTIAMIVLMAVSATVWRAWGKSSPSQ